MYMNKQTDHIAIMSDARVSKIIIILSRSVVEWSAIVKIKVDNDNDYY